MALKKENYETIFGIKAEHWIIQSININDTHSYGDITLIGFVDEDAYLNGKSPIETKRVKISYVNGYSECFSKKSLQKTNTNIYQLAYEYIKENDEFFKDTIDC